MNLFNFSKTPFKLHSGGVTNFKIDCDALTDKDWESIAQLILFDCPKFGFVCGVPNGGLKLQHELSKHITKESDIALLVDDVYTTGTSLQKMRSMIASTVPIKGYVVFARNPTPDWITPIFITGKMII